MKQNETPKLDQFPQNLRKRNQNEMKQNEMKRNETNFKLESWSIFDKNLRKRN